MDVIIRNTGGRVVSRSKNLRGIVDYARNHAKPNRVDIWQNRDGSAQLGIVFADDATVITDFASFEVCRSYVARSRACKSAAVHIHTYDKATV